MRFVKMTGIGNDYVCVDAFSQQVRDPARLAVAVADRHFGIGSDGLILVLPAEAGAEAHARMRMFNADGSEAPMCGNGIRCVCKMIYDHRLGPDPDANPMKVQTQSGVLTLAYTLDPAGKVGTVRVEMGVPVLDPEQLPLDVDAMDQADLPQTYKLNVPGTTQRFEATCVGLGNFHAVIYVEHVGDDNRDELLAWGRGLASHEAFTQGCNVHFVEVLAPDAVRVVHWERGSGPTLACGTGASAVCVAGVLTGRTGPALTAHLPGGDLQLEWAQPGGGQVYMTGPAAEVYTGQWTGV